MLDAMYVLYVLKIQLIDFVWKDVILFELLAKYFSQW